MATKGSSIYKGSDLIHDFCCSKCKQNDLNTEAHNFCPECGHYLCEKCVGLHNGYHNSHNVFGRGDIEQWLVSSIDRCDQHGKELEVHCDDHQEPCCSICVAVNHRLCNSISHIPDIAKGFQTKTEFKQLPAAVDKMRSSLDELKKSRTKDQAEFQKWYKNIVAEIKFLRKEIDSILDQIEKATIEQLDNTIGDLENDVRDDVKKCVNMNDQLKRLMENFNQMIGKCKETKSYIVYRKCTAKLNQTDYLISEIQRKPKEEIHFEFDKTIVSSLKSLKTFGFTGMNYSKQDKYCTYQVLSSKQYNVKMNKDEETCTITGICGLPSGHIVISDGRWNGSIKLLNSQFEVIDHCDLSAPNDVCSIAANEVAVAVCNSTKKDEVQIIKVAQGRFQKKRKFTTAYSCFSIAHHQDKLYVSSKTALYQYTMDGEIVKKIHEDNSGKLTVLRCAVSPDGEIIYVSNFDENKLISLDRCGRVLSSFTDPELRKVFGLCVSPCGLVFVSGCGSVIQVDSEGTKKLATLARKVDGMNTPISLCLVENTSTLVVGGKKEDDIVVLQLGKMCENENII
ncbi:uncharacterized protein LOC128216071 [Mya arenaria]|uniref:uncharacterized protein LOC128216071 n=1 Tax=Mya arenaria TaxID=6604 RepID=UPI0022E8E2D6|nr:uncharacterized protein LOC128216071 [Mya arenaria]